MLAQDLIRNVPDFPEPGIVYKDITPVLSHAPAFQEVIDRLVEWSVPHAPDAIAAIESRGFILGAPLAVALGLGLVLIRKAGKLPHMTLREEYLLEYGSGTLEMHRDSVSPGARILLIDDVLATGGTAAAAVRLIEAGGAKVVGIGLLIELTALQGRDRLSGYTVKSLLLA